MALPPGPPLPAAVQTLLSIADPIGFIDWCARRYGGCFTIDTLMFGTEVCVSDPATVKRIFTGDPDVLHAGEANVSWSRSSAGGPSCSSTAPSTSGTAG
jgi:cytochrome P450 family 135